MKKAFTFPSYNTVDGCIITENDDEKYPDTIIKLIDSGSTQGTITVNGKEYSLEDSEIVLHLQGHSERELLAHICDYISVQLRKNYNLQKFKDYLVDINKCNPDGLYKLYEKINFNNYYN